MTMGEQCFCSKAIGLIELTNSWLEKKGRSSERIEVPSELKAHSHSGPFYQKVASGEIKNVYHVLDYFSIAR